MRARRVERRRRRGRGVVAVAAVVAAFAALLPAASSAGPTSASNRARAEQEAPRLLAMLHLPPGASQPSTEPAGDHGTLASPDYAAFDPNLVDAYQWWTVSGQANQVLAYVKEHLPPGAVWDGGGDSYGPGYRSEETDVALAPIAGC